MLDVLMERVAAGLTVVVATHDLALARVIANQVLLVGDGRVRQLAFKVPLRVRDIVFAVGLNVAIVAALVLVR